MKKTGLVLLALLAFTVVTVAQNRGSGNFDPKEMAKRQTEQLTEELDLNKDQQKKVLELNEKYSEKMSAMFQDMRSGGGDREAMREKMGKMREEQNKEMKKLLTEDQYKKYEKYLEERRSSRGQGGPGQ
jgi:periplasmic protein CpxP/Spy